MVVVDRADGVVGWVWVCICCVCVWVGVGRKGSFVVHKHVVSVNASTFTSPNTF